MKNKLNILDYAKDYTDISHADHANEVSYNTIYFTEDQLGDLIDALSLSGLRYMWHLMNKGDKMDQTLNRLQEMVVSLNETTSTNDKKAKLSNFVDLQDHLKLIYSDFTQFGVTSDQIKKLVDVIPFGINSTLISLLTRLSKREVTGHKAIAEVKQFILDNKEYEQLILNAIDKNLECRIDVKLINTVFPKLIPTFEVALAQSIDKIPDSKKPNFDAETWFCSRKLDGLRLVVVVKDGIATTFSRKGKELTSFDVIKKAVLDLKCEGVFDGEACIMNGDIEDFQGIMKEFRRKDHTIENPRYKIFDYIELDDFYSGKSKRILSDRLTSLATVMQGNKNPSIAILQQILVDSNETFEHLKNQSIINKWEGVMLRRDCAYEGKRTNNLLKVKMFQDIELKVKRIETGIHRVVENGIEVPIEVMTNIICDYKGYEVGVGSGFSMDERKEYFLNPNLIIDKIVCIQYFEESKNEDGGISLRFPTFKCLYGEERDI